MATPAQAQVASLSATGLIMTDGTVVEELPCTSGGISVKLDGTQTRDTTVHVFAITQSGLDRFRNAPGRLVPNFDVNNISSGGPVTILARSATAVDTGICWRNDIIDSMVSEVMVVIANGPGYTVSPTEGTVNFTISDNDFCAMPASTPGGVVWKENPDCRCATESTHAEVRSGQSEEAWRQTLKNVARHFSDPSYLYCADSPYKGLL